MSQATTHSTKKNIQVSPNTLIRMREFIDDQIATSKLMQAELDLLMGEYQEFTPSEFLHDIKNRRNITV